MIYEQLSMIQWLIPPKKSCLKMYWTKTFYNYNNQIWWRYHPSESIWCISASSKTKRSRNVFFIQSRHPIPTPLIMRLYKSILQTTHPSQKRSSLNEKFMRLFASKFLRKWILSKPSFHHITLITSIPDLSHRCSHTSQSSHGTFAGYTQLSSFHQTKLSTL